MGWDFLGWLFLILVKKALLLESAATLPALAAAVAGAAPRVGAVFAALFAGLASFEVEALFD